MSEIVKTYETESGFQIEVDTFFGEFEVIIRIELWSPNTDVGCYNLYRKAIKSKHLTDAWEAMREANIDMDRIIEELECPNKAVDRIVETCRITRNGADEYGDSEHYRMMTNCINYLLNRRK